MIVFSLDQSTRFKVKADAAPPGGAWLFEAGTAMDGRGRGRGGLLKSLLVPYAINEADALRRVILQFDNLIEFYTEELGSHANDKVDDQTDIVTIESLLYDARQKLAIIAAELDAITTRYTTLVTELVRSETGDRPTEEHVDLHRQFQLVAEQRAEKQREHERLSQQVDRLLAVQPKQVLAVDAMCRQITIVKEWIDRGWYTIKRLDSDRCIPVSYFDDSRGWCTSSSLLGIEQRTEPASHSVWVACPAVEQHDGEQ